MAALTLTPEALADWLADNAFLFPEYQDEAHAIARRAPSAAGMLGDLVQRGWLTAYQAEQIGQGQRWL